MTVIITDMVSQTFAFGDPCYTLSGWNCNELDGTHVLTYTGPGTCRWAATVAIAFSIYYLQVFLLEDNGTTYLHLLVTRTFITDPSQPVISARVPYTGTCCNIDHTLELAADYYEADPTRPACCSDVNAGSEALITANC